ncbi:MAG: DnaD domain protein [Clostridia bacterium]|nr:DnaD domain protein [Clostridia bacterium]
MSVFIKRSPLLDVTAVSNVFLLEHMPKAPEGHVKVYLLGLMLSAVPGEEAAGLDIAGILHMDAAEVCRAFAYWQAAGLVRVAAEEPLSVEYLPVGAASAPAGDAPRKYASLVAALQDVAGTRMFSGFELSEIYDWIETFRFEEAAAVVCVKECLARCGAKAKMWQLNNAAKRLANAGVVTAAEAERFFARERQRSAGAQRILQRWKRSRAATEDELALYSKWVEEWGFDESVILDACTDATSSAQPSFKYLDSILATYRMNGVVTEEAAAALRKARDASEELIRSAFARAGLKRTPTLSQREQMETWHETWHMSAELILYAADLSREAATPFANMKKLITAWHDAGVATVAQAEKHKAEEEKKPAATTRKPYLAKAHNHKERSYTDEELAAIGIDLLAD